MRIKKVFIIGLLLLGLVTGGFPSIIDAKGKARTVRGEVMALNTEADTQIVVLRVITKGGVEMVVGALVSKDTKIEKKGKAATLGQLVEGDKVILTYEITRDGALARTITIP